MNIADIYAFLQTKAPFDTAEEWDNSGLLVGDMAGETDCVVVTLDITDEVVDTALREHARLIISHHPVIFEPLRTLSAGSVPYRLAQHGITALCVHTNLDKTAGGVNDCLAERLGLTRVRTAPDGMSRVGELAQPLSAADFAKQVAAALNTAVRVRAGTDSVRTVALCGGGGADLVLHLLQEADAALTGEVKHHEWLCVPPAKTLVDGGHYATEVFVAEQVAAWLNVAFSELRVVLHRGAAPYKTIAKD